MHRARHRLGRGSAAALLAALACFAASSVGAQTFPAAEPPSAALLRAGLEALHAGARLEADSLLTRCAADYPTEPLAPLFRMKLWWWAILGGDARVEPRLLEDFELVCNLSQARLGSDPADVIALYALGEAHCTLGRLQGIRGQGWAAVRSHRRGTPFLERAVDLAPEWSAPLASLGVYHYYSARAPAFLRFLGRFLQVEADRERGLQELWRAATTPGSQQEEATFFLVQILAGVEDDALEALPLAIDLHQRFPRSLPFALGLATVHLGLERPDLAVRVLEPLAAGEDAVAARFFVARTLCTSGHFAAALERLEGLSTKDLRSVPWLAGWHAYYRGVACDQLGRGADAKAAYQWACEAPEVADSQTYARRELARAGNVLLRHVRGAEASLSWDEGVEASSRTLRAALEQEGGDAECRRRATLALGVLTLQQGQPRQAAQILQPLLAADEAEEAWLVVRPRLRLLQALLWSEQREAAQEQAALLVPALGKWGSNRLLELLVQSCLQPAPEWGEMAPPPAPAPGEQTVLFRLKDIGFSRVALQRAGAEHSSVVPMRWQAPFWEVEISLPPGVHAYRFLLEGEQTLPDPEAAMAEQRTDGWWSLRPVEPLPDS